MTLAAVTLDCAGPLQLGAFYAEATGLALAAGSGDDFAGLRCASGHFLGFQRFNDYRPPRWPGQEQPQQAHLDLEVDDLDQAEATLLLRGASKPDDQPHARWRVLRDPAGHPFCLTSSRTVRTWQRVQRPQPSGTYRKRFGYSDARYPATSRPSCATRNRDYLAASALEAGACLLPWGSDVGVGTGTCPLGRPGEPGAVVGRGPWLGRGLRLC